MLCCPETPARPPGAQRAQPPDTGGTARPSLHSTALRPPTWACPRAEPTLSCPILPPEAKAKGQASPHASVWG